jgi:hypothetical protein
MARLRSRLARSVRDVEDLGAGLLIGFRHDAERGEGERVPGRRVCVSADRHHRPVDGEAHDLVEVDHPAVDDRQAGFDAAGFDTVAVVVAEARAVAEVQDEAAAADGEVAAVRLEGAGDVVL